MPKTKAAAETIEVDTQGQISIELDARYVLRPSFTAIAESERETGLSLFDLAGAAANGRMSIDNMAIIVAAMMRAYGEAHPADPLRSSYANAKASAVGAMIYEAGTPRVQMRIAVLLAGALTGAFTASGEAKAATGTK